MSHAEHYPEHDRTSCSDANPCNAQAAGSHGCARCTALVMDRAAPAEALQTVRMRLETAHRLLSIATGPSGARAALHEIDEAIRIIDGRPHDYRLSDEIRSFIEGMSVSVDVSTGDSDEERRYFGTVTEVMDDPDDKHCVTLLVQDAKPNFSVPPAPAGLASVALGEPAFQFENFQQWVNHAQSWFGRARLSSHSAVAIDAAGRICMIGKQFHRARDEGTFPVRVYPIEPPAAPAAKPENTISA